MGSRIAFHVAVLLAAALTASNALAQKAARAPKNLTIPDLDEQASNWWRTNRSVELAKLRSSQQGIAVHFLVHLPSGVAAPPYSSEITEGRQTQIVIIIPTERVQVDVSLDVTQPTGLETFRIEVPGQPPTKPEMKRLGFELREIGPRLSIGPPTLEYKLKITSELTNARGVVVERGFAATQHTVRVNPIITTQDLDELAYDWWLQNGDAGLEKLKTKRTRHYLVHLPSGAVLSPYPSDITEGARAQIVMIIPTGPVQMVDLKLAVTQCTEPETFRTKFPVDPEDGAPATMIAAGRPQTFQLMPIGSSLRCGPPALNYEITVDTTITHGQTLPNGDPVVLKTEHSLRVNPKYHIAAIAALGWDTAKDNEYSIGQFVDDAGNTTDEAILWRSTTEGAAFYLGAQWMIMGVDYHNMKWWNYFANLWLAVNVTSSLKDFAAGIALTPTGGIGVALGMTFHQKQHLNKGLSPGDPFASADEPIPQGRGWDGFKPGFFVGVTLDSNIYRALAARGE